MDKYEFATTGKLENLAEAYAASVRSGLDVLMPPPHSAPSTQFSRADIATPETDFDSATLRLTLVAMMTTSLALLLLTSESPRGEPSSLAFTNFGDGTSSIAVILAFGLWAAGCTAIRKTRRTPSAKDHR